MSCEVFAAWAALSTSTHRRWQEVCVRVCVVIVMLTVVEVVVVMMMMSERHGDAG